MTKYTKVQKTVVEADDSENMSTSVHQTKTVPEITKHKQDNSFRSKVEQIAEIHKRKIGGIQSRLKKLGLIKE